MKVEDAIIQLEVIKRLKAHDTEDIDAIDTAIDALERLSDMKQWRINYKIENQSANISGLCCPHCYQKDEYIVELENENRELRYELLRG